MFINSNIYASYYQTQLNIDYLSINDILNIYHLLGFNMHLFYADGSSKQKESIVVTSCVVTKCNKSLFNEQVLYVHKNKYHGISFRDNLQEILAIYDAICIAHQMKLKNFIILNDSIHAISWFKSYFAGIKCKIFNKEIMRKIESLIEMFPSILNQVLFLHIPRTSAGINLADFFNKDISSFIYYSDIKYIPKRINQLSKSRYDFNISSCSVSKNKQNDYLLTDFMLKTSFI